MIEDEDLHAGALEAFQIERASSDGMLGAAPEPTIPKPLVYLGIALLIYFLLKELKK